MLVSPARTLGVLLAATLVACRNPLDEDPIACTANVQPAVVVEIRDARDGRALAANARGVVRDGAFVDSLRPYESSSGLATDLFSRQAAGERAGTYTVEVEHDGYQPWTIAGVRASRGVCHVETRRLAANLQPAT
jgi:hypothetical protein